MKWVSDRRPAGRPERAFQHRRISGEAEQGGEAEAQRGIAERQREHDQGDAEIGGRGRERRRGVEERHVDAEARRAATPAGAIAAPAAASRAASAPPATP